MDSMAGREEREVTGLSGRIYDFFRSLRTSIWLLLSLICLLLYGSVIMPLREEFQALHTEALFPWMMRAPAGITWWLWASLVVLSVLTANTIVCSIDSIRKKWEVRQWLLVISPQVIHIGFLLILMAHLMSSIGSIKATAAVVRGSGLDLGNGHAVTFRDIGIDVDKGGYARDWRVEVLHLQGGQPVQTDSIRPNSPSFRNGLGIYVQAVKLVPYPVAFIEVSREPGAPWALAGGIAFLAGTVTLLMLKIRREESEQRAAP